MHVTDEKPGLKEALRYASLGWRVIPTNGRLKHPTIDEWQRLATNVPSEVEALFAAADTDDVAIVTGVDSGIFVLDVDPRHGGVETLEDLQDIYGRLPDTPMSITGSQGFHFVFRYPSLPEGVLIRNDAGKRLGPGLDIRGEGGQISAPPTVHANGRRYEWELSSEPGEVPVADAPSWLIELLLQDTTNERPRQERAERIDGEMLPGDRFMAERSWPELLEEVGASFVGSRDGIEFWSRPPLPGESYFVPHTSASLYYKGSDVLKVFTPNWAPLEEGQTYDKLGFWAEYNFEGANHEEKVAKAVAQLGQEALTEEWSEWFSELEGYLATLDQDQDDEPDDGWSSISLIDAAKNPPPPPEVLEREDGEFLLYAGRLHYFYGLPESGKSWAAQLATKQAIGKNRRALYLDFENDPYSFVERLQVMGIEDDGLELINYKRPQKRPIPEITIPRLERELRANPVVLIVVDGVSNAMGLFGLVPEKNEDVVKFEYLFLRPLCDTGAAVVCIDHAPKNQERPTIFGAQHKLAQVTGATLHFSIVAPFGRGLRGKARMMLQKDKPGYLRRHAMEAGYVGDLIVDSTEGATTVKIDPPTLTESNSDWVPETIMTQLYAYVKDHPGQNRHQVIEECNGKLAYKRAGLQKLIADGHIRDTLGSGRLWAEEDKPFGVQVIDLDRMALEQQRTTGSETEQAMARISKRMSRQLGDWDPFGGEESTPETAGSVEPSGADEPERSSGEAGVSPSFSSKGGAGSEKSDADEDLFDEMWDFDLEEPA